jgi:hypothetical protein
MPGANGPTDDCSDPATTYCISDALIRGQAAAMHARGFVAKTSLTDHAHLKALLVRAGG